MHKTYSTPKVVRTWVLLFSVPLYIGAASLWMKEEIKLVVSQPEKVDSLVSIEEQVKETFEQKKLENQTVLLLQSY